MIDDHIPHPEPPHPPHKSKTEYFSALATQLFSEMKLNMQYGKLSRTDDSDIGLKPEDQKDWIRVTEHSLVEAAAAQALGEALGLDPADIKKLVIAGAVHDWDKRLEVQPQHFTDAETKAALKAFAHIGADPLLLRATKPEFLIRGLIENTASELEHLQRYIDVICNESDVTAFEQRIDIASARHPYLTNDPAWGNMLEPILGPGKNFWDGEKEMARREQQNIFERLRQRGFDLASPQDVPAFIKAHIEKNYK